MEHFSHLQKDKKLYAMLLQADPINITKRKNVFLWLLRSVAGQQLSTKAAATIFERFLELLQEPTPQKVLSLSVEEIRSVGFSQSKANYLQNIAAFWKQENLTDASFAKLTDEYIIDYLCQIKGVGKWTVQMLLMFTLSRPNVFAVDDLGIQQAMTLLYGWKEMDLKTKKEKMLMQSKKYSPTNTLVCMHLWKWKDDKKNAI